MSNRATGFIYALGASLALASSLVISKSVFESLGPGSILHFGFLWFSLGVIWNGSWFLFRKEYKNLGNGFGRITGVALLIAILEGAATGLFYLAIEAMENPAVVSFLGNAGPVFVTLMGLLFLRERFRPLQMAGIAITLVGLFIMNYREGSFSGFTETGSIYVLSAAFLFSLATIFGRKFHRQLNPAYMSLIRSVLLALVMSVLFFSLKGGNPFSLKAGLWGRIGLGSFLETLVVIVFTYMALKLIEATRTSLIISTKGVWALVLAWIFLGIFPTGFELTGGLLTLAGVWLINTKGNE